MISKEKYVKLEVKKYREVLKQRKLLLGTEDGGD